jgi:hypothetical protein
MAWLDLGMLLLSILFFAPPAIGLSVKWWNDYLEIDAKFPPR